MNKSLLAALGLVAALVAPQVGAQVTFYEHDGFRGRAFTADRSLGNFADIGFNDRASSVIVQGGQWQVCEDAGFAGRCTILRPGQYPSLAAIGLSDRISSTRRARGAAARSCSVAPCGTPKRSRSPPNSCPPSSRTRSWRRRRRGRNGGLASDQSLM